MPRIGFHCSHEQYAPERLLELVRLAEAAGFDGAMCSDHFHPWTAEQGESGFALSWLGAAMQATSLPFGVVTVPGGWRYHPTILAQAAATLSRLFPGRLWMAPGSGEALNEAIVGEGWPEKSERNARLLEGVEIMRALWAGETVSRRGRIRVEEARLFTLPEEPPQLIGAALTPETARWMGGWADGLITVVADRDTMREVVDAFREGGGEGKPLILQAQLAFARSDEEALTGAWEQWRSVLFDSTVLATLRTPEQFAAAAEPVSREFVGQQVRVSADPERHLAWLKEDIELGFDQIYLHNLHRDDQQRFIETFGEQVVPELRRS
jgi:coenzyme F420-dependent glucose-6-phosphate dehydrogenase